MKSSVVFELNVQRSQDICRFNLSWGKGQKLPTLEVPYPLSLDQHYREWKQAYLNYYSNAFRAKQQLVTSGGFDPNYWRTQLRDQEYQLLHDFNLWLRHRALSEMQRVILTQALSSDPIDRSLSVITTDIFLTCQSSDLESLPWEAWDLLNEKEIQGAIQLTRSPAKIRYETVPSRSGRPRILILSSDQDSLDLNKDRELSYQYFKGSCQTTMLGWGISTKDISELKDQLIAALDDPKGWDVFLFFGHSDEGTLTGGELAIAPQTWIGIDEISSHLETAKKHGLRFALFNSCSGLNIAGSLISLGLSQVIVMREPIHNQVAQQFLDDFLGGLSRRQNVQQSMSVAVGRLKLKYGLEYPSAHLIPSLFRHQDSELFQLPPQGWKILRQSLLPKSKEAIALGLILLISFISPVQEFLLETRVGVQALYRQITQQIPRLTQPPVQLVIIDQASLKKAKIAASDRQQIDRRYLAKLINKASQKTQSVIGLDYLLDSPKPNQDPSLVDAVKKSVQQKNWIVFGTSEDENSTQELTLGIEGINPDWSLSSNIDFEDLLILPPSPPTCPEQCPFSYILSLIHTIQSNNYYPELAPTLKSSSDLSLQLFHATREKTEIAQLEWFNHPRSPFNLRPIIDYSIPANQVYELIPAWQFLESSGGDPEQAQNMPILLIAAGGYEGSDDIHPLPLATYLWGQYQPSLQTKLKGMIGGEAHAYQVHHWLSRHWVIPIPDIVMLVFAIVIGKGLFGVVSYQPVIKSKVIYGTTASLLVYGGLSLQLFVGANLLLPWFWPALIIAGYSKAMMQPYRPLSISS